ncbi:long-chain fatty acid--CoA ligase [Actinokineospora sp. NBRC 105648]|uniref:AMP-dependent synthetase/ligase n=1 Tax=Actinokineospora sp. NBRC 105648 TaxID=3032206 RepID=UPI0024A36BA4|nr:long-chain fatty acid--CoA ligase [Actinokineospora sp. NBRC 105648]GLZ39197.1 long-chain acyl-CoA synthetase [Actinokineospora sp. NBRC 105648]
MREFSVTTGAPVAEQESLTDMVWANAERFADAIAFRRRVEGSWLDVTTADFAAHVLAVAKGLVASGLEPGDRVALLSRTRYEWTLFDFAVWAAGGVTVPVYETSSAEQVAWVLADSGARAVVVETDAHRHTVESVVDRLGEVVKVWQLDGPAVDELTALGAGVPDATAHERRLAVRSADVATLVYTSGTTGRPKGVVLTHRNLLAEVRADLAAFPELMRAGNSMLVFLPLAHVFARAISLCCVYTRTTLGHLPDVKTLQSDLATYRPTFVVAVPRVFEKVYNSAKQRAHASGNGGIFDAAEEVAVAYSQSPGSLVLRAKHAVASRLVYAKLRAALGGRCVAAISGSAPLGEHLAHFFRGVGIPVYEGYGLTETSAAICVNTQAHFRVGTVGRPVAGASVRVADDGEIELHGDMVFTGYWKNPDATADALVDGWLRTGDLGELDEDGYLRITGRKKEIIVTAGGKNVAPAVLEDAVRRHPLVSQCLVIGDRQPFIAALITLDEDFLPAWTARHGKAGSEVFEDPDLRAEIQTAVDEANEQVSRAEAIREFVVLPRDFTEAAGELTPSLKLRRDAILKTHAAEVASIYAN